MSVSIQQSTVDLPVHRCFMPSMIAVHPANLHDYRTKIEIRRCIWIPVHWKQTFDPFRVPYFRMLNFQRCIAVSAIVQRFKIWILVYKFPVLHCRSLQVIHSCKLKSLFSIRHSNLLMKRSIFYKENKVAITEVFAAEKKRPVVYITETC